MTIRTAPEMTLIISEPAGSSFRKIIPNKTAISVFVLYIGANLEMSALFAIANVIIKNPAAQTIPAINAKVKPVQFGMNFGDLIRYTKEKNKKTPSPTEKTPR